MAWFRPLVLLPLCLAGLASHAQQGGDLEAQIIYAFYSEDANRLAGLVQLLTNQEESGDADDALRYHLAHAEFRLGLLRADSNASGADAAFAGCIEQLKGNLQQDVKSVESLALQGACYSHLARRGKLQAVLLRSRADDRLAAAEQLAPRNPRVELLRALEGIASSKEGTTEHSRAVGQLQLAAQLFEQSSATSVDLPGWGHAEAYLELGRQLQVRGDVLGARNWIEKSLIIAPDFKAAQRQLATLGLH